MTTDKIYLVGFMGAGKSTVAVALAKRLGWQTADIDVLIESREHRSIAEIFTEHGEPYFRQIERVVLKELSPQRHTIVATGGGTFVDPASRLAINNDGTSVWLDVSFDQVLERLAPDGRRPLVGDRTAMLTLYEARRSAYELAHLKLDTNRSSVGELVERIVEWLGC